MSNAVTHAVMNLCALKGERRMLMLCLAFHANDDGVCWPSQRTLAAEMNCSERGVQKMVDALAKMGEFSIVTEGGGRGKSATYRLAKYVETSPIKGEPIVPPLDDKGRTAYSSNTETERANVETLKGERSSVKGERGSIKGEQAVPPNSIEQEENRRRKGESASPPIFSNAVMPNLETWLCRVLGNGERDPWDVDWWTKTWQREAGAGWAMKGGRRIVDWCLRQDGFTGYFRSAKTEHEAKNTPDDPGAFEAERAAEEARKAVIGDQLASELLEGLKKGRL